MTGPKGGRRRASARADVERQIDDELSFHRDSTVRDLMAQGATRTAAEAEAERRFGPADAYRTRLIGLDARHRLAAARRASMHILLNSVRAAGRDLRRSPGFAAGVIAILTLGLGVNAISFSIVDRLVLSGPAGIVSPGELRRVVIHRRDGGGSTIASSEISYSDYEDLRRAAPPSGVAAESAAPLLAGAGEAAERIQVRLVTGDYFGLLGVAPALGRFFTVEESAREGRRYVVLGHALWQRRFGSDPAAIGRTLAIGANRYTVIGVAPRHFTGTSVARTDAFLPLEAAADELVSGSWRTNRGFRWMQIVVRVRDEAAAAAESAATALHRQANADNPNADPDGRIELASLNPARGLGASADIGIAALVGAVALLVLVIAIANAANLFLARSLRRRAVVALQHALGGARWRLTIEQAVEGALLASLGGLVAAAVAWLGGPIVQRLLFPQVAWLDYAVDIRLLLAVAVCAIVGGSVAAAIPMLQTSRRELAAWVVAAAPRSSRRRTRMQTAMLVVQSALSVLLLVGAGLFVRSLNAVRSLDVGLDTDRLMIVGLIGGDSPPAPDLRDRLRQTVEKIPGIERTTLVEGTMPFVSSWAARVVLPGVAERPRVDDGGPYVHAVEAGYFDTAGTAIVEGRPFAAADRDGSERVVIVNQTMARLFWPGESPLGKCLQIGSDSPPCSTVVGVAQNTRRQELIEGDSLLYYIPFPQAPETLRAGGRLLIRTTSASPDDQARIAETVRRQAMQIEPSLRYVSARSLDDIIWPQLRSWRLGAGLFGAFGILALLVAAIGLYSVLAFTVEGQRREIGIRAALGATSPALVSLVVGDGVRIAGGGIALGLVLAWWLSPFASNLLYGVTPRSLPIFITAAAALVAAAVAASAVPGLRASRVDPVAALRSE